MNQYLVGGRKKKLNTSQVEMGMAAFLKQYFTVGLRESIAGIVKKNVYGALLLKSPVSSQRNLAPPPL